MNGNVAVTVKVTFLQSGCQPSRPYISTMPPNTDYFCKGYDYGEKADLSKGNWNPKRITWITTHFSEIIKQPAIMLKKR